MQVRVGYHDGLLTFDAPADRLLAAFAPPPAEDDPRGRLRRALESPLDYPPLRQVVVPGDRVAAPIDPKPARGRDGARGRRRDHGGGRRRVDRGGRRRARPGPVGDRLPAGRRADRPCDPRRPGATSHSASTTSGRRIYLNRRIARRRLRGADRPARARRRDRPHAAWSVIDPARERHQRPAGCRRCWQPPSALRRRFGSTSRWRFSWLLGSMLQLGIVPAESGWGAGRLRPAVARSASGAGGSSATPGP